MSEGGVSEGGVSEGGGNGDGADGAGDGVPGACVCGAGESAEQGGYFAELDRRLRERGMPRENAAALVAELAGHTADSGTDPHTEFGPAADFAGQLAPADGGTCGPEPDAEHWTWTADAYTDQAVMNRMGAQGWEIERVDRLGRFVSSRDPQSSLRWEYRRDVVARRDRAAHAASIAADGWEPCGHWLYLAYYKRPLAVLDGPAATLADPPERPARSVYFTRRLYLHLAWTLLCLCVLVLLLTLGFPGSSDGGRDSSAPVGAGVGAVLGALLGFWLLRRQRRQMARAARYNAPESGGSSASKKS